MWRGSRGPRTLGLVRLPLPYPCGRFHGHRETDVQGAHHVRRYDMQLLAAAEAIARRYEAAAGFAMAAVLGWDVDALAFE